MNVTVLFRDLNSELKLMDRSETIYVCGGAALLALGVVSRETQDVDVLCPQLSPSLLQAASRVGERHGLNKYWLNNQVEDLGARLPSGWRERAQEVFRESHLCVLVLHRQDLISSKLLATCDRDQDYPDLVALHPTQDELLISATWTKTQKKSAGWEHIVDEYVNAVLDEVP